MDILSFFHVFFLSHTRVLFNGDVIGAIEPGRGVVNDSIPCSQDEHCLTLERSIHICWVGLGAIGCGIVIGITYLCKKEQSTVFPSLKNE